MNVTDDSGSVLVTYTYDVFGGIRTQSAASDNYWTFTGEQTDEESGFSYLRARYYDPEVGRFLSSDPLGGGYPYAGNNPANATDPSGLASCAGVSGAYSISTDSSGNTACYDEGGQILSCTGVCAIDFNSPLSSPVTITEEELAADMNTKGAPVDDAAEPVVVVTKESSTNEAAPSPNNHDAKGSNSEAGTMAGSSAVVITPPNTGGGGCYHVEPSGFYCAQTVQPYCQHTIDWNCDGRLDLQERNTMREWMCIESGGIDCKIELRDNITEGVCETFVYDCWGGYCDSYIYDCILETKSNSDLTNCRQADGCTTQDFVPGPERFRP